MKRYTVDPQGLIVESQRGGFVRYEDVRESDAYAERRLGLLREVMGSDLPRSSELSLGFGRLLRDDLIERIRDHLRDTTHSPDSPIGRDKALKTPSSAGSTPAPGTTIPTQPAAATAEASARGDLRPPSVTEASVPVGLEPVKAGNEIFHQYRRAHDPGPLDDYDVCECGDPRDSPCHSQGVVECPTCFGRGDHAEKCPNNADLTVKISGDKK